LPDDVGKGMAKKISSSGYDRVLVNVDPGGDVKHSFLDGMGKTVR
jgi:hypothetical protein